MSINQPDLTPQRHPNHVRRSARVLTGGFSLEAIVAAAVVVLTIVALADFFPEQLASIAVIAMGAALLIKSGTVASQTQTLRAEEGTEAMREVGTELSAEMLAAIAGIVLGILALVGLETWTLIAVSVIVYGGALLFGGRETYRIGQLDAGGRYGEREESAKTATTSAGGAEFLVGIAAIVLGIVALMDIEPVMLSLIGLLALGAVELLAGLAASTRFGSLSRAHG